MVQEVLHAWGPGPGRESGAQGRLCSPPPGQGLFFTGAPLRGSGEKQVVRL